MFNPVDVLPTFFWIMLGRIAVVGFYEALYFIEFGNPAFILCHRSFSLCSGAVGSSKSVGGTAGHCLAAGSVSRMVALAAIGLKRGFASLHSCITHTHFSLYPYSPSKARVCLEYGWKQLRVWLEYG